jgi:hypothetical protein
MTFEEWVEEAGFKFLAPRMKAEFKECWDSAVAAETVRCSQIVWENRGKCMNDELARALMAEVRRVR